MVRERERERAQCCGAVEAIIDAQKGVIKTTPYFSHFHF